LLSASVVFGQFDLDTSNIDRVYVLNSDTSIARNITAYITYYSSPDSCVSLFKSNNVHDYDTLFISEKKDFIIYRYENTKLLINYSVNNSEAIACEGLLQGDLVSESFIIYYSPASDPNKNCDKSIILFDCAIHYSATFRSNWIMEKERLELKEFIKE